MNPLKAGGAALCAMLLLYALEEYQFEQSAIQVSGTVESVRTGGGCLGSDLAVIRVRGNRMDHSFGMKGRRFHVGDRVDVLVDPEDPTDMMLGNKGKMSWMPTIVLAMALAMATLRVD